MYAKIRAMVEIVYLGHSCFKIKSGKLPTVLIDPFDPKVVGLGLPKQDADIVCISHQHEDHNCSLVVSGATGREAPFVIDRPGEYEIGGVEVRMVNTFHDNKEGDERGKNLVCVVRIDGVFVVHLGDLGHSLSDKKVEEIGYTDVLMIPVGGIYTIPIKEAVGVINQLDPGIVVPMHYKVEGLVLPRASEMNTVDEFLKIYGVQDPVREKKLKVSADSLPENTIVEVLEV